MTQGLLMVEGSCLDCVWKQNVKNTYKTAGNSVVVSVSLTVNRGIVTRWTTLTLYLRLTSVVLKEIMSFGNMMMQTTILNGICKGEANNNINIFSTLSILRTL